MVSGLSQLEGADRFPQKPRWWILPSPDCSLLLTPSARPSCSCHRSRCYEDLYPIKVRDHTGDDLTSLPVVDCSYCLIQTLCVNSCIQVVYRTSCCILWAVFHKTKEPGPDIGLYYLPRWQILFWNVMFWWICKECICQDVEYLSHFKYKGFINQDKINKKWHYHNNIVDCLRQR
jgi:hypothetical protein